MTRRKIKRRNVQKKFRAQPSRAQRQQSAGANSPRWKSRCAELAD